MIRHISNRVKKTWAALALLSVEMAAVVILFILSLIVFIIITRYVFILKKDQFDFQIFSFLENHVSERNNAIMLFFTFLGTHLFLIPASLLLIIFFLFIKKHKWFSIKVPAIAISSVLLMFLLKNFFGRERPDIPLIREASGLSYPSGHALMSVTFYGLLIYILWRSVKTVWLKWTWTLLLLGLILTIGFTRIYLRVHYPSDVLAGFATGFLWLVISISILRKMEKYSNRNIDPIVESETVVKEPPTT